MLDPLVDGEDGEVARVGQATAPIHLLDASQHLRVAVGEAESIHHLGVRKMQSLSADSRFGVEEQFSFGSELIAD